MSKNELIIRKPMLPMFNAENLGPRATVFINYDKTSDTDYTFTSRIDDDININISKDNTWESVQRDVDDIIDVQYEESIPENELLYYGTALASGLLTGLLSNHISAKTLEEAKEAISGDKKELKKLRDVIIIAARLCGCKEKDYKKAVKFLLLNKSISAIRHMPIELENAEFGQLSGQPTIAGLVFSILTQFSGQYYYLDEDGEIKTEEVHEGYVLGQADDEKLALAAMYWFFYVCAAFVTMGKEAFEELKLPDGITKLVSGVCQFIKENKENPGSYEKAEEKFENWLDKLQKQSREIDDDSSALAILKEKMGMLGSQMFPVLLNEGLVRASYTLGKLAYEIKKAQLGSVDDIFAIEIMELIPYNSRIMSNMCMVASGAFLATNIGPAVVKAVAIKLKKKDAAGAVEDIVTKLNIAGIGRFVIAFADNSKYFNENVQVFFNRLSWNKFRMRGADQSVENGPNGDVRVEQDMEDILRLMMLDRAQTRMLYSIENLLLEYDIAHTKKPEDRDAKIAWQIEWQNQIGVLENEEPVTYFAHDEKMLYDELYRSSGDKRNHRWMYVMAMELCLFEPYMSNGSVKNKLFRGLKPESDYTSDVFVVRQTVVSQKDTELIRKYYKHYKGVMDGSTKSKVIGAASASAAAVAVGVAAFTFAPGIAVALVGGMFPGLHGAALVNAALATFGGGALAAGGFGMAGGTAVITGGGALIGLTGTSAVAAATTMLTISKEYWVAEYAKLLTFVKFVLKEKIGDKTSVARIKAWVPAVRVMAEEQLKEMKKEKTPLDSVAIEATENYLKYLKKLEGELNKI